MTFNVNEFLENTKKEYGLGGGEYLKAKEGDNRMRILSNPVAHAGSYKGQPTFKFLMFVLDRTDNIIKPYFMPISIMDNISQLQLDNDWGFDGFPMPYDINVRAIGAGTKEVKYSVIASPKKEPLTADILEQLSKKDIHAFQEKLKAQAQDNQQTEEKPHQQAPVSSGEQLEAPPIDEVVQNIPF